MTFKYRSPNDKSINIGGLGSVLSYVKPIEGCPEAGQFIRSNDTSRWEYDVLNQAFWMPYSVPVFTDGNCGESFGSEVWGLQYLPAGWVTASYSVDVYVNPYGSNTFVVGQDEVRSTEDGTGINSTLPYQSLNRLPFGSFLMWTENSYPFEANTSYFDNFSGGWVGISTGYYLQNAYLFDGSNGYFTGYYIYSGQPYPNGTYVADQPDSYVEVPSGSGNTFFDGNDNRYEWDGSGNVVFRYSGLYPYGTFITNYGDYNYYWNGSGGYYQGEYTGGGGNNYPSYGTYLDGGSGYHTYHTDCGDLTTGDYSWASYADGNGGSYTNGYSNYIYYGSSIGVCNDINYFSDGSGGVAYSYWVYGHYLGFNEYNLNYGTWYVYGPNSGNSANYMSSSTRQDMYADGNGGTYYGEGYMYYPPFGELIANSNYTYTLYDEYGNSYGEATQWYNVRADGMANYYIEYL